MRTSNWIVTATLLASLSAVAQQPADSQSTSQPAASMSACDRVRLSRNQSAQPQPAPPQAAPHPPRWTRWSIVS